MSRTWGPDAVDRSTHRPAVPVVLVSLLSAASGAIAAVVGAVSLTRIAGDLLGFPPNLAWTFTGAVDVAAAGGAVLWVTKTGDMRRTGVCLNVVCSAVSAWGVGLDHASHAVNNPFSWWLIAFVVGAFLPALSTWMVHVLARLVTPSPDRTGTPLSTTNGVSATIVTAPLAPAQPPATKAPAAKTAALSNGTRPVSADAQPVSSPAADPAAAKRAADAERKRTARAAARAQTSGDTDGSS